jgi:uncharacterized protein
MSPPPSNIPAGWFPDPSGVTGLRYWDGRTWTPYTAPGAAADAAAEPHPTLPLIAAIAAIVVTVVSLVGSRFAVRALGSFDLPIVAYVALAGVIGYGPLVAFCLWASRRWGTGRLSDDIGLRVKWIDTGWGPVAYAACFASQIVVGLIVLAAKVPMKSNTEGLDNLAGDRDVLVAFLITAVIAAPIVEEMMFRGVVMRGLLSRFSAPISVALQGVLFGLVHYDPARGSGNIGLVMVLSGVGIVLGAAAFKLRRIGPTMIAHAMLNSIAMFIVLVLKDWLANA